MIFPWFFSNSMIFHAWTFLWFPGFPWFPELVGTLSYGEARKLASCIPLLSTLCRPMGSSIKFDTVKSRWSIAYIEGSQDIISKKYWFFFTEDHFCLSKQCRPWWNAACSISSGSYTYLSYPSSKELNFFLSYYFCLYKQCRPRWNATFVWHFIWVFTVCQSTCLPYPSSKE